MSASLLTQIHTLARYNRRANRQLYDACAALAPEELARDQGAFFRSVLGTLNHILLVDRIWLARFTGTEIEAEPLCTTLYDDFEALRAARKEEDDRIVEFCVDLKISFLSSQFRYKDHAGMFRQDNADLLVLHFFNHQTHHRGQIHHMLVQTGASELSLDLHRLIHP